MDEGTGGLSSVIAVGGDRNIAHAVRFNASGNGGVDGGDGHKDVFRTRIEAGMRKSGKRMRSLLRLIRVESCDGEGAYGCLI